MSKCVINRRLEKGKFKDYRITLTAKLFQEKQAEHPERYYYFGGLEQQYFNEFIPNGFESSDIVCPSNHNKKNKYCIYIPHKERSKRGESYIEYIKIPFVLNKISKKIIILSFYKTPRIIEKICQNLALNSLKKN